MGFLPRKKVLWIADHSGYESAIKEGLRFHRLIQVADLTDFLQDKYQGGLASMGRGIRFTDDAESASPILDTIYCGHSHESLALQLADVCCSVITQHLRGTEDGTDFFRIIRDLVKTKDQLILYSEKWAARR